MSAPDQPEHPTLTPKPAAGVAPDVVLDWEAYWVAFQDAHGGDPVPFGGRLLFRDGWTYSATDHAGPEWPPPADPDRLRFYRAEYWRAQRGRARAARDDLKARVTALRELQAMKSAPLQVTTVYRGEGGKLKVSTGPLDQAAMTSMTVRLEFLEQAVVEAEREFAALALPAGTRLVELTPTADWDFNPHTHEG